MCVLQTIQGTTTRNVAPFWPGASNMAIRRSSRQNTKGKIAMNTAKNQTTVFQLGGREGTCIKLT